MANNALAVWAGAIALTLAVVCLVTGCKSSGSEYVAPRVEGRVLDADTHQPLDRVRVKRMAAGSEVYQEPMRKGGQRMEEPFPAYTGKDGRFVIDSERALVLFAQMNWFSLDISFEHSGYDRFMTNYTLFTATNTPSGEPLINTGDIFLQRTKSRQKSKNP